MALRGDGERWRRGRCGDGEEKSLFIFRRIAAMGDRRAIFIVEGNGVGARQPAMQINIQAAP
jgi:hypothetical protein